MPNRLKIEFDTKSVIIFADALVYRLKEEREYV
jgi:hypothetical protein